MTTTTSQGGTRTSETNEFMGRQMSSTADRLTIFRRNSSSLLVTWAHGRPFCSCENHDIVRMQSLSELTSITFCGLSSKKLLPRRNRTWSAAATMTCVPFVNREIDDVAVSVSVRICCGGWGWIRWCWSLLHDKIPHKLKDRNDEIPPHLERKLIRGRANLKTRKSLIGVAIWFAYWSKKKTFPVWIFFSRFSPIELKSPKTWTETPETIRLPNKKL